MGAAWHYRDSNPAMSRMGRRTLARLILAGRYTVAGAQSVATFVSALSTASVGQRRYGRGTTVW